MKRISNFSTGDSMPEAKLAINKSLLKEYSTSESPRTVYMDNGTEFQFQVFNPTQNVIGVKFTLNGIRISNMLVLRPGERVWLERYLNEDKKFKFSSYVVGASEEVKEAIKNNGKIKIEFFNEIRYSSSPSTFISTTPINIYYHTTTTPPCDTVLAYPRTTFSTDGPRSPLGPTGLNGIEGTLRSSSYACTADSVNSNYQETSSQSYQSKKMETGRVEQGGRSNQNLDIVDTNFEFYAFYSTEILILPSSRKVVSSSDLNKIYCHECGKKISTKYKFCPFCGTKL